MYDVQLLTVPETVISIIIREALIYSMSQTIDLSCGGANGMSKERMERVRVGARRAVGLTRNNVLVINILQENFALKEQTCTVVGKSTRSFETWMWQRKSYICTRLASRDI